MTTSIDPEGTERKKLLEFAGLDRRAKPRVLEVGCGDGRLTWRYAPLTGPVAGVDRNADDLRVARIERPSDLDGRVEFVRADAVHLPLAARRFDLAIFSWSF